MKQAIYTLIFLAISSSISVAQCAEGDIITTVWSWNENDIVTSNVSAENPLYISCIMNEIGGLNTQYTGEYDVTANPGLNWFGLDNCGGTACVYNFVPDLSTICTANEFTITHVSICDGTTCNGSICFDPSGTPYSSFTIQDENGTPLPLSDNCAENLCAGQYSLSTNVIVIDGVSYSCNFNFEISNGPLELIWENAAGFWNVDFEGDYFGDGVWNVSSVFGESSSTPQLTDLGAGCYTGTITFPATGCSTTSTDYLSNSCPGDLNGDGLVSTPDLLIFLGNYNNEAGDYTPSIDFNCDNSEGSEDLLFLIGLIGTSCP